MTVVSEVSGWVLCLFLQRAVRIGRPVWLATPRIREGRYSLVFFFLLLVGWDVWDCIVDYLIVGCMYVCVYVPWYLPEYYSTDLPLWDELSVPLSSPPLPQERTWTTLHTERRNLYFEMQVRKTNPFPKPLPHWALFADLLSPIMHFFRSQPHECFFR